MLEKIREKYDLDKEETTIVFTDESKTKDGRVVGVAMVQEGEEEGHYISMDKRCTIFTAEACAIVKAIQKWTIDKDKGKENLLIMSDALSVVKKIENNIINVYSNIYII